jgi:hypothetical protein
MERRVSAGAVFPAGACRRVARVLRLVQIGSCAIVSAALLLAPAQAFGAADLSVSLTTKSTSLPLGGPETTELTLAVSNTGPDPAENVSAEATIGTPELVFSGFVGISQGIAIFSASNDPPITASFGTIGPGATATVKWTENDANSGLATLTANATTSTTESGPAANTSSVNVEVVALVPSSSSLLFGEQTIGRIGAPATLTFTNRAAIPLEISRVGLDGADFVLSADGCSGATLAVDASCQMSPRFAPAALGTLTGSLTAESATTGASPVAVALTGTGEAVPIDVKAASLQLARVPKSIGAKRFRKGFSITVTPDEAVSLDVQLLGRPVSGALASAFDLRLFGRNLPRASTPRTIKVKPKGRLLGPLSKKIKVQLKVTAVDAAGNSSTATRRIAVKPAPRR